MTRFLALIFSICLINMASAAGNSPFSQSSTNSSSPFSQQSDFLPVDQAFQFAYQQQDDEVYLNWAVTPEYYLYQHQFSFKAQGVEILPPTLPEGIAYHDDYFGDVVIYRQDTEIVLNVKNIANDAQISVTYQGCADAGLCYPPETKVIYLSPLEGQANTASQSNTSSATTGIAQQKLDQQSSSGLADILSQQSLLISLGLFFLLGIGLAFTPCVFPMYPILSGIIVGQKSLSTKRSFLLSFTYVQGMALTYTLLGLVVAMAGLKYQAALQHPVILISLAMLFTMLSLSMFGLFNLQLPSFISERLNKVSNQQQGGSVKGVFLMGLISGLVCSPCTTAPLSGALLYVAGTGDLVLGGAVLYALSLGMGLPLLILGTSGGKFLPKAGMWMVHIKVVFGFLLLSVAVVMLERFISATISSVLFALLGLALLAYLAHAMWRSAHRLKALGLVCIALAGASVMGLTAAQISEQQSIKQGLKSRFIYVTNLSELQNQLAIAKQNNQAVMVDFYADWCVACKDFEKATFTHNGVIEQLDNVLLIQADVTKNNADDQGMLSELNILGLPSILFYNQQGERLTQARVTGFMAGEQFLQHLQRHEIK
ncbi:protein-disulfide reductase DsbD [Motilimonas cestriensis]|uniref:Thiol:disulfide interchange protein DsbD n=1 Tax=Motilimonas cestriensis TaxID=2742685 RepID=A0ABS8W6U3_9GAMM|nr:protein-disulfide reductase DsbD [Motilimonas cestriensis]MCE2594704.1 protein-disulfide reductase DsbD [Motilimonas cestriensis]